MITQPYSLSLQPGGVPIRIPCVQGDAASRTISLSLISCGATFTPPSGAVVTFDGTKPDGKSFSVSGTISGSAVSVTLTAQMTAVAGEIPCRLTLVSGTEILGTAEVLLVVAPSAIPTNPDLSDSDMSALTDLKNAAAQSAINASQQVTVAANSATSAAQSATAAANSAASAAQQATAAANSAAAGKADLAVPGAAGNLAKLTAQGNLADSGIAITTGSWSPTVNNVASYTLRAGRYAKIGGLTIVFFQVAGTFNTSTGASLTISGCPVKPSSDYAAGGGHLSGYHAADNTVFSGWKMNTAGSIIACGQLATTSANERDVQTIYPRSGATFELAGTIAF